MLANITEQVNSEKNDDDRIMDEDSVINYNQDVSDNSDKDVNITCLDDSSSNLIAPDKKGTHFFY